MRFIKKILAVSLSLVVSVACSSSEFAVSGNKSGATSGEELQGSDDAQPNDFPFGSGEQFEVASELPGTGSQSPDPDFSPGENNFNSLPPINSDGLFGGSAYESFCSGAALKTYTTKLSFPSNRGTQCDWNSNGNYKGGNRDLTAHRIFKKSFSIPSDSGKLVICDFSLTTKSQQTTYDDDIAFMLNGALFMTDYLGVGFLRSRNFEMIGQAWRYDFAKVRGSKWPATEPWASSGVNINGTKLGYVGGKSDNPRLASFDLSLSKEFLRKLPAAVLQQQEHEFSFVIHGNRHSEDCQHSGMDFDITVTYVDYSQE